MLPEIETRSASEIKAFQEGLLQEQVAYNVRNSPYYQRLFRDEGLDPADIRTLEDLRRIPPTTKDDLQEHEADFICVPRKRIVDHITTSGTQGDPVTFALTDNDLDRLAYNEAISFACSGCDEEDLLQLMTTMDRRFMAGLAYFLGARRLGAGIVRVGSGVPALQWDTIQRMGPTVLITVPSFLLKMVEYAEANGIDHRKSSVQRAICIGEPLRDAELSFNSLAQRIKEVWDIELCSTYASTEMATAFNECPFGKGGHHHPELIITEFLDEEGEPVPADEPGELTVTTLGVEGMPLMRYRTGDVCYRYQEPCECGRRTLRVGPVIGRKQQMIKYKGTTFYPPALYDILNEFPEVRNYMVEVFTDNTGTDQLQVHVGTENGGEALEKSIRDHFRAKLRVAPTVNFCAVDELEKARFPETKRKPVKFIDHRKEAKN
ncbi:MAG: phenylacetate--CoA ligase family protein [Flavobacteriales bacterium]